MENRNQIHEYQLGNRVAKVFNTQLGFEVDLYEGNNLRETRKVHDKSEYYAEDTAQNWVEGIIK